MELADGRGRVGHLAAESRAESIYTFCSARMHMQTVRNNDIYIYINSIYIYDIIYKYNIYIYDIYIIQYIYILDVVRSWIPVCIMMM